MIHTGDCLEVMAGMEPESVDAIVTDPPYDLTDTGRRFQGRGGTLRPDGGLRSESRGGGFMGKAWDGTGVAFRVETWQAALRVARPGAYLLAFGGTRTVHRLTVALEDAGWIIRDLLVWAYASGFPKSKASLKPAWEPIVLCRKPGPLRELNIDDCRIGTSKDVPASPRRGPNGGDAGGVYGRFEAPTDDTEGWNPNVGRWPANLILTAAESTWYTLRDDIPEGTHEAIRAYYGSGEAMPPVRSAHPGDAVRVGAPEVLLEGLRRDESQGGAQGRVGDDGMSPVRDDVRGDASMAAQRASEVLLAQMSSPGERGREEVGYPSQPGVSAEDERRGNGTVSRRQLARLEGREVEVGSGVRVGDGVGVAGRPARDRRGDGAATLEGPTLHHGASAGDGIDPGSSARESRGGPSPQRGEGRQPLGEPVSQGSEESQPDPSSYRQGTGATSAASGRVGSRERRLTVPRDLIPDGWLPYFRYSYTEDHGAIFDGGWDGVVGGGETSSGVPGTRRKPHASAAGTFDTLAGLPIETGYGDSGTYSRFFLIPKASRTDREPKVPGELEATSGVRVESAHSTVCRQCGRQRVNVPGAACSCDEPEWERRAQVPRINTHPTVKPTELMRHLVRLVMPQGGTVLDPFAGSGSTLIAAEREGFDWIGIEREPEYVTIAQQRLVAEQRGLGLP